MGEIADGLINGEFDFYTGEYIGRPVGYPRSRNKGVSWETPKSEKRKAFHGVAKYVNYRFGITDATPLVNDFIQWGLPNEVHKSLKQKCILIQDNWSMFLKWVNQNYKPIKHEKKT